MVLWEGEGRGEGGVETLSSEFPCDERVGTERSARNGAVKAQKGVGGGGGEPTRVRTVE